MKKKKGTWKSQIFYHTSPSHFPLPTKDPDQLIFINSPGRETLYLAHAAYAETKELINKVRVPGQPGRLGCAHHCNCE